MKNTVMAFLLGGLSGYIITVMTTDGPQPKLNNIPAMGQLAAQLEQLEQDNENLQAQLDNATQKIAQTRSNAAQIARQDTKELPEIETLEPVYEVSQSPAPVTYAQTVKAIEMYQVLPVAKRLESQLNLDENTASKLQTLLLEKAQRDYQVWLNNQPDASQQPVDMQRLTELFNENSHNYAQSVREILTDEQLATYVRTERQQAEVLAQQKLMHLQDSLTKVNLDEYQQQEISRLANQLYHTDNINIGSMGSPYGVGSISINSEKLEAIKSVLTEEQLQSLML
ncbi:hypothetical protein J8M20_09295 [Pseudoalteromonas luteoviolacea]|uniref:hypothetical protein n=1 Tax=Pseudoalteromonas luteoviolacea TaxID=43657 RepID=UPI001B37DDCF|nr:hypothetical protein [Pseudoalteromonas luteoviolacea]MBQ4811532.1 hypothetical protein [Pseudoalteromonas luteoviolacea]